MAKRVVKVKAYMQKDGPVRAYTRGASGRVGATRAENAARRQRAVRAKGLNKRFNSRQAAAKAAGRRGR